VRACIIFNPMARGEKATLFRARLSALAQEVTLKPTQRAGGGRELASEAVREGFDTIVAAGGDGTVNEVLNGIVDAPEGLNMARLAVLPLGTVNVFAKEIRMPATLARAWSVIRAGQERRVDLGEAEFATDNGPVRRCFVQMAGAGVDARAVELVDWELKKKIGMFAYIVAGLKAMREAKPLIEVSTGGVTLAGEQVVVGNGRYYGGRYRIMPRASLDNGRLDVSVMPHANWTALARCVAGLLFRRLYTTGGLHHAAGSEIEIRSSARVPFQLEGDLVGRLPARLRVRPRALRVIVPPESLR
jgi:YegS/Rv2252/BmrU family lipid kinase